MNRLRLFNDGWSFLKTSPGMELPDIESRREEFRGVDIPHDWLIYDVNNLYEDSTGWYLRKLSGKMLDLKPGERIYLRFDGVYMDSTLYVNRRKAGDWKYGYSAFGFDITDLLDTEEENELLLQVRFLSPNSRWYSGAGIYRNVWLRKYPKAYLPMDGTYVTTREISSGYRMEIETECAGDINDNTRCRYTLLREGQEDRVLGWGQLSGEKESLFFNGEFDLSKVDEWDIDAPNCYRLRVELFDADPEDGREAMDTDELSIGFCRMEFSPDEGFFLNGRHVKLNGVCEHHDLGCLGAAFHKDAMRRKLTILKEMGVNAIRTSHNMPAAEVMDLADEMGFLVVSEAFDMWERTKTTYDYGRFFKEWAKKDVRSWIRRDRNHPCLLLWSIGNEIYDTHADEHGQEITRRLMGYVREHDPKNNAPITIGSNYMPWEGAQNCADIVKIAGYNYGEKYYAEHHKKHPDWIIYGSETASVVHSRGIYRFPLSQSVLADEDEQCSSLGNSSTSWGAKNMEQCILTERDTPFSLGQFLWTGFDYIGEPTPYHTKNSYFGQIDTAGFPKDTFYLLQAEWTNVRTNPMVHLFPYWDFNEGQLIDVRACTNGDSVELIVNGISWGRQTIDHRKGSRLTADWQVPYQPGEIEAIAYDAEGHEIAREKRHSFTDSVQLKLTADRVSMRANGEDLCFITVEALDGQGRIVENAMDYVRVEITGEGRLLGLDNGDSTDTDPYKGCFRKLFMGKLLAVVAATDKAGTIKVRATSPSLNGTELVINTTGAPVREGISFRENVQKTDGLGKSGTMEEGRGTNRIPVRKLGIEAPRGTLLTPEEPSVPVTVRVFPENADDKEILLKLVNTNGIEISHVKIEEEDLSDGVYNARLTALGDGAFQVRAFSKSGGDKIKLISQLDFMAKGLGTAFLNPYRFLSAGLFSGTIGEVSNGNEKGIATARDGKSGVYYTGIDFGAYGADTITMPVFALSDAPYPIEIWEGIPNEAGSRLIDTVIYQKPSKWNVYQEETWKLSERFRGVSTIGFVLRDKVHLKGFSFLYEEKAFRRLTAAECDQIYGDSFTVEKEVVGGIGNNVTLVYEDMDFGERGAASLTVWGHTALKTNTIHVHFTPDDGEMTGLILEYTGDSESMTFPAEGISGRGKVELIFLPGSSFDLYAVQFQEKA